MQFACLSCTPTLYKSEAVHDPILSKKGEISAQAALSLQGIQSIPLSYDLALAYAPVKHLGLKTSFKGRYYDRTNESLHGYAIEAGAGYFTSYGSNGLFSIYANVAQGINNEFVATTFLNTGGELNSKFMALSLQPSVATIKKKHAMAGGIRMGVYKFYDIVATGSSMSQVEYNQIGKKLYPAIEPYYLIEIGSQKVRFHAQAGFSITPVGPEELISPKLSMGITARFGK